MNFKNIIPVILILFFAACSSNEDTKLEFSFKVNEIEGLIPSYQMAIWLEKPDGEFVKTFFVCDYLSFSGFNIDGICPRWVKKSDWIETPEEIVDAVTGATPDIGDVKMEFDCSLKEIPPGKYKYFIEIHNTEKYNELYSGNIKIKKNGTAQTGESSVKYIPKKYPEGSGLLTDVKVKCITNKN